MAVLDGKPCYRRTMLKEERLYNDNTLTLFWEMLLKSTYCDPSVGLVVMVKQAF